MRHRLVRPVSPVVEVVELTTKEQDKEFWQFYIRVFAGIHEDAVMSHILPYEEFLNVMDDQRVRKYFCRGDDGAVTGLAVMTTRISAFSWISDAYFAKHHPDLWGQQRIFYVGWVGAAAAGVFKALIARMVDDIREVGGAAAIDWAQARDGWRVRVVEPFLDGLDGGVQHRLLDTHRCTLHQFTPKGSA